MELTVTTQIAGNDVVTARLFTHARRGIESATFSYADEYLGRSDAYALAPELPLSAGPIHTAGRSMFAVFQDTMPDRWGRNLMLRSERREAKSEKRTARTLLEADMLAGVDDETRQGAIRFWRDDVAVAPRDIGVPREVSLPDLLSSADRAAGDMDADVRDLVAAGSSLGGARPKASVRDEHGRLLIAKFPRSDESSLDDISAWERTALTLAGKAGIEVPSTRLLRIGGRGVLLLERFDRRPEARVPYLSGMTAIQGHDGEHYSYLELVDFLEQEGASPDADIVQLWRRVLFSAAIGNTDDHMRNHGFLRARTGWKLAPAFDLNPTPGDQVKQLNSMFDDASRTADPDEVVEAAEFYRLSRDEARQIAHGQAEVLSAWREVAQSNGVTTASLNAMASNFEAGVAALARV